MIILDVQSIVVDILFFVDILSFCNLIVHYLTN